jgi:hypothetical protein
MLPDTSFISFTDNYIIPRFPELSRATGSLRGRDGRGQLVQQQTLAVPGNDGDLGHDAAKQKQGKKPTNLSPKTFELSS